MKMLSGKSKYPIFVILLAVFFMSCSKNQNDCEKQGLHGKVKSCSEKIYKAEKSFGEWGKGELMNFGNACENFDSKGNCTEIEYFDETGKLSGKTVLKREKGKVIEEIYYRNEKDGNRKKIKNISEEESVFELFNEKGEKIQEGTNFYKKGNIVKTVFSSPNDEEKKNNVTTFEYDKNNNLVLQKWISGNNQTTVTLIYDKDNRLTSEKHVNKNEEGEENSFSIKYKYLEFDSHKNWTKRLIYGENEGEELIVVREILYY